MSSFGNTTSTKNASAKYDQKPWKCIAITLEPGGTRYQTFSEGNKHLQVETFQGIKGEDLQKEEIISQGLATKELSLSSLLTNGAIGCAASHKAIWDKASTGEKGYFVLEDDCYTHPRTADFINYNIEL